MVLNFINNFLVLCIQLSCIFSIVLTAILPDLVLFKILNASRLLELRNSISSVYLISFSYNYSSFVHR